VFLPRFVLQILPFNPMLGATPASSASLHAAEVAGFCLNGASTKPIHILQVASKFAAKPVVFIYLRSTSIASANGLFKPVCVTPVRRIRGADRRIGELVRRRLKAGIEL